MGSRPRRPDETFEQYRENLLIEQKTDRHRQGKPVSRYQIDKLRDINARRHAEFAVAQKKVEQR